MGALIRNKLIVIKIDRLLMIYCEIIEILAILQHLIKIL